MGLSFRLFVFFVTGYGTYTVNPNCTGVAFMLKGGIGNCPEWTMFRHDQNRSGYMSTNEVNTQCSIINDINGSDKVNGANVKISPQPFQNKTEISVFGMNTKKITLRIMDLQGRLIESKNAEELINRGDEHYWNWNSEKVTDGIYLYQIYHGNKSSNGKLVKSK